MADLTREDSLALLRVDASAAQRRTRCLRRGTAARITCWPYQSATYFNGDDHCTNMKGGCGCTHAEQRAVLAILTSPVLHEIAGRCTLWVTLSPCTACANLCVNSLLFSKVVYLRELKHDLRGIDILRKAGIEVVKGEEL